MASAQPPPDPSSATVPAPAARKQGHLEAGKKRLEEFRKKKAAKKVVVPEQEAPSIADNAASVLLEINQNDQNSSSQTVDSVSNSCESMLSIENHVEGTSLSASVDRSEVPGPYGSSWQSSLLNGHHDVGTEYIVHGYYEEHNEEYGHKQNGLREQSLGSSTTFHGADGLSPTTSTDVSKRHLHASEQLGSSFAEHNLEILENGGDQPSSGPTELLKGDQTNIGSDLRSLDSSNMVSENSSQKVRLPSTSYPTSSARSRLSFLSLLGISRVDSKPNGSAKDSQQAGLSLSVSNSDSKEQETGGELIVSSSVSCDNKYGANNHDGTSGFPSPVKDNNNDALQQIIRDLTDQKISLQQALHESRRTAEALAADHSALSESYNNQGHVIAKLKSDNKRLQAEIKAQLLALESVQAVYANAQHECNAAKDRGKVLASEIIALEEKALRLRSNELKLEKLVEQLNSEISSYRKKVSTIEKERQDFQSTIDALQEESKILQAKLREISVCDKEDGTTNPSVGKRDVATETEELGDLAVGYSTTDEEAISSRTMSGIVTAVDGARPSASKGHFYAIPQDQLQMIDNINALISQIGQERNVLKQALIVESANCSQLRELTKKLKQKLEFQTQKLELLTAQNMANENSISRPRETLSASATSSTYADEGDEVVERVLGWIMRMFPGGTRRRTSRLL